MLVKILDIIRHSAELWSFRMTRPEMFSFKPGQFLMFSTKIADKDVRRAYSISSAPGNKDFLEITVKLKPDGIFTPLLFKKSIGDEMDILGPFGIFHFDEADIRIPIFIGGGTGIAPLLSMLRTYLDAAPTNSEPFYLFYGIKKEEDEVFKQELAQMTLDHERFNEIIAVSEPDDKWQSERGYMCWDIIKKHVITPKDCTFYVCGPEAMVNHIIEDLQKHGVPDDQIKLDHW